MELQIIQPKEELLLKAVAEFPDTLSSIEPTTPKYKHNPFIEANTKDVSLSVLKNDCIIPVFSKDNEKTLAHQEFIQATQDCVAKVFPHHTIDAPEIRTSHQIKGV